MSNALVIKSFGTILTDNTSVQRDANIFRSAPIDYNLTLPTTFDGKSIWAYYLSPITFQGFCGNCWAKSTVTVLADRFSILSKNYIKPYLSPVMVTVCDGIITDRPENDPNSISQKNITKHSENSCFGNSLSNAFKFLYVYGAIDRKCLNYGMLLDKGINIQLDKFQSVGDLPKCQDIIGNEFIDCVGDIKVAAKYFRASTFYKIDEDEMKIKQDIFKFGPVASGFILFTDFLNDYDGTTIYMGPKKDAKPTGGHAIKVVGWGEENVKNSEGNEELVKYWIIANSWGKEWGDSGYFRMKIGIQECQLEKNFYGCIPDIPYVINPYLSDLGVREPNLITERNNFKVDEITGYLDKAIPMIKNGEILGNLEPIFPENLGYDLKDFVAGEIPLFPAAFDPRAIKVFTKKRDYKPIYILILFITLILSVISTILISKLLSKSSQSDEEIY